MEGRAMFGMLSVMAELQRELIVANTNDGLASARARGHVGGDRRTHQGRVPATGRLPIRRQFLDPSMGRDRALPRPRPDGVLRLVDPPPTDLTDASPTTGVAARGSRHLAAPRSSDGLLTTPPGLRHVSGVFRLPSNVRPALPGWQWVS
ncbi:recombinase family protein [Streptomyces sp. ML-6]|uniref:recombinase family protein n=1 Tax=Streptomyces sp. ML-6 TaxID=2982693 RepID=UPI0024C0A07A|nr:recombinase family protein [Streptomyces sp. ML-6]MDK0524140.1 recombinase family protein [Streptomyces sp. ML-6]